MTRTLIGSFALGALTLLFPAVGSAQTRIDVGVWTPGGGGRVVIGGAPVYRTRRPVYVPARPVYVQARPVYIAPRPVYVVPGYRYDRGGYLGRYSNGPAYRGYYGRDYRRDVVRADREYQRNISRAQREYYGDLRDARRDRRR